jgi:protein-tyrosine phosphatase
MLRRMTRHIAFERLHNFRDLGGYRTADGHTLRWGRVYRADSLAKLRGPDWDRFRQLGIRTVIDLRYPWEIADRGRAPDDGRLAYHNLSIEHRPYDQPSIPADVDPWRFLADRYAEVAEDGVKELRQALEVIAGEQAAPVVFHCASGKDRTGLLAALVLTLVGVAEEDVLADFALTELATERLVADWTAAHDGMAPQWAAYGRAPAEILRLFLADLSERYGSVHGYAEQRLGVDAQLVAALRRQLIDV